MCHLKAQQYTVNHLGIWVARTMNIYVERSLSLNWDIFKADTRLFVIAAWHMASTMQFRIVH